MPNETTIINSIKKLFPTKDKQVIVGIGDDAAVIQPTPGTQLVYTCDSQVEGTHFLTTQIQPKQLGFRAMSAAVSDIAAMGAAPKFCLVSLFLPKRADSNTWISGINQGIAAAGKAYNTTIIGGNMAKSSVLSIDIFVIGEVKPGAAILQSGAKVDDVVMVTGTLGNAHTGWRLLQNSEVNISEKDEHYLKMRHFMPKASVKEAQVLANLGNIHSMIDISDGLSTDLLHLCDASNVGVKLFARKLPLGREVKAFAKAAQIHPLQLALQGGEDFQLLFTADRQNAKHIIQKIKDQTGTQVTVIGHIETKEKGRTIVSPHGEILPLKAIGYDHLA